MIVPPPALLLLVRLRARGLVRKQRRRLRTPKGALLFAVGLLLFGTWGLSLLATTFLRRQLLAPDELAAWVRAGGLVFVVLALLGSLGHRGLSIPREEVEQLFTAPLARSDLVRYRMIMNGGRSLIAWLIFGSMLAGRAPVRLHAVVGSFLALQTLGVFGQAVALWAGGVEQKLFKKWSKPLFGILLVLTTVALTALVLGMVLTGRRHGDGFVRMLLPEGLAEGGLDELLRHPLVTALGAPLEPWARMISTRDTGEFLLWSALCTAILAGLFELTARMPVDFRELTLATSSSLAERIRRTRRLGGFGASVAAAEKGSHTRRVPWLFGRGPLGAIAWRKSLSIARRARATMLMSAAVLLFLGFLTSGLFGQGGEKGLIGGAAVLAVVGPLYLCGGLRFDFREDLDCMESVKTWPLRPTAIFAATLLPEVLLVSALVVLAIGASALLRQTWHPALLAFAAVVPILVSAWVAIDNLAFLIAPVRMVPGQEGMLSNMGRMAVTLLLRMAFFAGVMLVAAIGAGLAWVLTGPVLDLPRDVAVAIQVGVGALATAGSLVPLAFLGGAALGRFDVARDRG